MKFYTFFSILFLLSGLVILGCGDEAEDNNANVLDPQNGLGEQNSPIVNSLIPLDEIPVITIEKTREDAENIWWRLKADPAPIHGDLVIGLEYPYFTNEGRRYRTILVAIPKFENTSVEMKSETGTLWKIITTWRTIAHIIDDWDGEYSIDKYGAFADVNVLPPFQLDDGYVVPQGFQFSYYLVGEPSELRLVPGE